MKQELIELIAQARNVVENKEREIFENNKARYTTLTAGFADVKEHIDIIEMNINKFDDELLEKAKNSINYIINALGEQPIANEIPVSEAVIENETTIDETTITEPTMEETYVEETEEVQNDFEPSEEYNTEDIGSIDFDEEELNKLLAALDSTNFDALLDEANNEEA